MFIPSNQLSCKVKGIVRGILNKIARRPNLRSSSCGQRQSYLVTEGFPYAGFYCCLGIRAPHQRLDISRSRVGQHSWKNIQVCLIGGAFQSPRDLGDDPLVLGIVWRDGKCDLCTRCVEKKWAERKNATNRSSYFAVREAPVPVCVDWADATPTFRGAEVRGKRSESHIYRSLTPVLRIIHS